MRALGRKLEGALGRVFPGCVTIGQAVAFNMFLAFFPMLLVALGLIDALAIFRGAAAEIPARLQVLLPPGTDQLIGAFFTRRTQHPGRLLALGAGGTLLAGTQVMVALMQGFRVVYREQRRHSYLWTQLRALFLLCMVLGPWNIVVVLTVFGRRSRAWVAQLIGLRSMVTGSGVVVSLLVVLALALAVLMVLYRVGRDDPHHWNDVFPGAFVATILWWVVDMLFGLYVRHVPYRAVYGGVAAAIGLLLWMYMTAMVIFFGAAYNAQAAGQRRLTRQPESDRVYWPTGTG